MHRFSLQEHDVQFSLSLNDIWMKIIVRVGKYMSYKRKRKGN